MSTDISLGCKMILIILQSSVHLLLVTSHTWSHIMVMMHVFLHSPLCHCQSHGLISVTCFWCFGLGKALVKTSAVCCGSQQLSIFKVFCSTWSCTQCQCVLICFDVLWNWGFLAIAIEPSLSPDEQSDVVEYRQAFVEWFKIYKCQFHTWDISGNELPHPSPGHSHLVLITHDKSTFYQNDQWQIHWGVWAVRCQKQREKASL